MNCLHTIIESILIFDLIYTKSLLKCLQIAGLRAVEGCVCVCCVLSDQLMMIPGSSAVGNDGGRGRNWLSPQGDRGFKVKIETGVVEMRSNLKLYK